MRTGDLIGGRYRLSSPIGSGSMGQVWRAHDERLARDVAIKIVPLTHPGLPLSAAGSHPEAKAAAMFNHPNIVTVLDADADPVGAFIVMELLDGESLADRLVRGPLPITEVVRVASGVVEALAATHARGVVHRDIKPGNVMLTASGGVKVLDFGIAELTDAIDPTSAHVVIGTASFMAPEQASGQRATSASDIYSLGCIIFAMLAGRPPFLGATSVDIARQQVESAPPSLAALRPGTPPRLAALVDDMLRKDAVGRPRADAVRERLRAVAAAAADGYAPPQGRPVVDSATAVLPSIGARGDAWADGPGGFDTAVLPSVGGAGRTGGFETAVLQVGAVGDLGQRAFDGHSARPAVAAVAQPGTPLVPRRRPNWQRRAIVAILLAIAGLLVVAGASALVPRFVGALGSTPPSPTTKVTTKASPTPTPTPAPPKTPTPRPAPTIALPTIPLPTLPTLPSAKQIALTAAFSGVTAVLDNWTPDGTKQAKAQDQLSTDWATASEAIQTAVAAGDGRAQAILDAYAAEASDLHQKKLVPDSTYAALVIALKAVGALI